MDLFVLEYGETVKNYKSMKLKLGADGINSKEEPEYGSKLCFL